MKQLFAIIFILTGSVAFAQKVNKLRTVTNHSIHVIGDHFEGVIFTKTYRDKYPESEKIDSCTRFTPSSKEVGLAEKIITEYLQRGFQEAPTSSAAFVYSNSQSYLHQYVGYVNKKGEKVIYLNSFRKNNSSAREKNKVDGKNIARWLNSIYWVMDGGNYYWQASISLSNGKVLWFSTNGVA